MVKVVNTAGTHIWARALLDGGSQINLITERLVQRLRVQKNIEYHRLGGIGKAQHASQHSVHLTIHSHCTTFKASWKFHVLSDVTWDQPSHAVDPKGLNLPKGVKLADPQFHEPGPIDLLIGREGFNDLLLGNILRLDNPKLLLQNTELGWIVSGQEYVRRIWKRWNTDYLSGLQPRTRWTAKRNNIQEGTMVLVKEENLPPLKWRLGRVQTIKPGKDGLVRVVDVRTKDGTYRRAISKICVLPGQKDDKME
uniref:DUF5641 domain-containing protein n=1 Tax=Anopheles epiroticus TaxID=199890 RepID=A0A182PX47_9DIPT